jgi:hypothetical protein
MKIRGNTVGFPNPQPDWNQTDPTQADYIKNKPEVAAPSGEVTRIDFSSFEAGSFTEIVDGEEVTHTVSFDGYDRPNKIDGVDIVWGDV